MNTSLEQVRDRLRREVERIERDRMKYDECAYRTPSATLDDLADAIDAHLSRAAEPVYQVTGLAGGDWMDCDRATYDEAATWAHGEDRRRILHTHPPEPARDAEDQYIRRAVMELLEKLKVSATITSRLPFADYGEWVLNRAAAMQANPDE